MGTLDHQIKLTTAQVIFLFLASSRQLYLFKQNFYCSSLPWLPQPPLQNKNLKQNKKTLPRQLSSQVICSSNNKLLMPLQQPTPSWFTGDLLIQQQAIDAIAAADAKLGLIEGKLSAFAGETATLKAAVDAYEAVVNTEGYGPTVQLFTPNV